MRILIALIVVLGHACAPTAYGASREESVVAHLAGGVYVLRVGQQSVKLPMEMSASPGVPHAEVTRVVIVFHGKGRNVEGYYHALEHAAGSAKQSAGQTLLLAPQFLREEDVQAHRLGPEFLRWHLGEWTAGDAATGPVPLSTFDVIDALLSNLADRSLFPHLRTVVLFGHSGGGQLLHRYAIVSTRASLLQSAGIHVRYVIANPSSYFYFSDERPQLDGSFAPYRAADCPDFNHWRYGPAHAPAYVADTSPEAWQQRETAYSAADVIYLLGSEDIDPRQRDLDTSCAGEAQGSERLARGQAYYRYLRARHPQNFQQKQWLAPAVAHNGEHMLESPCGIAAIFDGVCAEASATR